jgi:hypothetical protein
VVGGLIGDGAIIANVLIQLRVMAGGFIGYSTVIADVLIQLRLLVGINKCLVDRTVMLLVMDDDESDTGLVVDDV